jgi:transcriptional regulator with GAF, ATPase, and Fis domain
VSKQHEISSLEPAMQSNSRAHSALIGIYEISKLLTRPSRLEMALSGVINLLASFLDMNNGLIALLDEQDRTSTVVGAGWSEATAREHFERLPEQAVGQIVVSGMPLVVRNIAESSLFTDWSELNSGESTEPRSFVGVPIKGQNRTLGTIMIERFGGNSSPHTLDEDVRFLSMVANLVGQTVELQTLVARDRDRLMSERHRLEKELEQRAGKKREGISGIIGNSAAIQEVVEKVRQIARCNLPVLLCGESGTGKELFARAIHEYSPRSKKPYIRLNCAALSETVLESELFGHERGAFTGAVGLRKGRFELADGGTLFLASAEVSPSRWMSAWWPRPTGTWKRPCSPANSAPIFTIASAWCRFIFPLCANAVRMWRCWHRNSCAASTRSTASLLPSPSGPWMRCAPAISPAMCANWKAVCGARLRWRKIPSSEWRIWPVTMAVVFRRCWASR